MKSKCFICTRIDVSFIGSNCFFDEDTEKILFSSYFSYGDVVNLISYGDCTNLANTIENSKFLCKDLSEDIEIFSTNDMTDIVDLKNYDKKYYFDRQYGHWWELE